MTRPRIALVTGAGASDGIGFAIARRLAREGCDVVIAGFSERIHQRAGELVAEGFRVRSYAIDLTRADEVSQLSQAVGPIDILVNNAGMGSLAAPAKQRQFLDLGVGDWDRDIAVTLGTAFLVTRAFAGAMVKNGWGRIVNVASVTGPMVSSVGESAYSAAKAGMVGLTHALALEFGPFGVTVNAVAPGWIGTGASGEAERVAARFTPAGRAGTPDEVAAAVAFLASADASYVNGATLVVDGGNILQESKVEWSGRAESPKS